MWSLLLNGVDATLSATRECLQRAWDFVDATLSATRECLQRAWDFLGGAKKWRLKSEQLQAQLNELQAMHGHRPKHADEKKQIERMLQDRENDLECMNSEVHDKDQEIEKQKQQVEHWKRQFYCVQEAISELQQERESDIQLSRKRRGKSCKSRAQERRGSMQDHAAEIARLKETIAQTELVMKEGTERFELLERAFLVKLDEMADIEEARNRELHDVKRERDMVHQDFWDMCEMVKSEQAAVAASEQKKKELELKVEELAHVKREKERLEERLEWLSSVTSVTSVGQSPTSAFESFDFRTSIQGATPTSMKGGRTPSGTPRRRHTCGSFPYDTRSPVSLLKEEGTLFGDAVIPLLTDDSDSEHGVASTTASAILAAVPACELPSAVQNARGASGECIREIRGLQTQVRCTRPSSYTARVLSFFSTMRGETSGRARGPGGFLTRMQRAKKLAYECGSLSVLILIVLYAFHRGRSKAIRLITSAKTLSRILF